MGRNGALSIEERRPRWSPLWFHSTNLLNIMPPERLRFDAQPLRHALSLPTGRSVGHGLNEKGAVHIIGPLHRCLNTDKLAIDLQLTSLRWRSDECSQNT
jgi:hypothetical protein